MRQDERELTIVVGRHPPKMSAEDMAGTLALRAFLAPLTLGVNLLASPLECALSVLKAPVSPLFEPDIWLSSEPPEKESKLETFIV